MSDIVYHIPVHAYAEICRLYNADPQAITDAEFGQIFARFIKEHGRGCPCDSCIAMRAAVVN